MSYYTQISYDILADDYYVCFTISFETKQDGIDFIDYFNSISKFNCMKIHHYISKYNLLNENIQSKSNKPNKPNKSIDLTNYNQIMDELNKFIESIINKTTSDIYSQIKNNQHKFEYMYVETKWID